MKTHKTLYIIILCLVFFSCNIDESKVNSVGNLSWDELVERARGKKVNMMMWQGDPLINDYMSSFVKPRIKEEFGIDIQIVPGQGSVVVSTLMSEIEAGKTESEIDLCWINGETFFQLRQIQGLYGPFVEQLPNSSFIDWENPFIAYDFQQPVDGYECPWGNVQMALIYNSEKVEETPQDLLELKEWVQANPGRFTIGNDFTGMTLLKSWFIYLAGGQEKVKGGFDEELYNGVSPELFDYINDIRPYLWNNGESFPSSVAQMHQLFTTGEIWFTMSNNQNEVYNKKARGIFPEFSEAYIPEIGTIRNSHYLGIPSKSSHKAAAMVVCNFMISPEAQFHKRKNEVWGDGTVLDQDKLPVEWQTKFENILQQGRATDKQQEDIKSLMEPAPEYMIRLFEDFRKNVIEQ